MRKYSAALATIAWLFLAIFTHTANASALNEELQRLITNYRAAGENPREVLRPLKWSGITDTKLFDIVEADLLENLDTKGADWAEGNAWRVQSLAYSGNAKYLETIKKTISSGRSSKLRRHAKSSLEVLDDFAGYNEIISANLETVALERLTVQRIVNMIESDNFDLIRAGASRIYHHHPHNPELIALSAKRIEQLYLSVHVRFPDADAVGWLCKVLGKTEDMQHEPLLRKVSANSHSKDLRRHARTALITLEGDKESNTDTLF